MPGTILITSISSNSFNPHDNPTILHKPGTVTVSIGQKRRKLKHGIMYLLWQPCCSPLPMCPCLLLWLYVPLTNGQVSFLTSLTWSQSCHTTCFSGWNMVEVTVYQLWDEPLRGLPCFHVLSCAPAIATRKICLASSLVPRIWDTHVVDQVCRPVARSRAASVPHGPVRLLFQAAGFGGDLLHSTIAWY